MPLFSFQRCLIQLQLEYESSVNGTYTLTAAAYDSSGLIGSSQKITVNVSDDAAAPT